jgi:hypothetical protein
VVDEDKGLHLIQTMMQTQRKHYQEFNHVAMPVPSDDVCCESQLNARKCEIGVGDPKMMRHHPGWLNMTVENLVLHYLVGLIMTFVATRDIQPGEEIFLDYGDSWEKAWNEHVEKWTPAKGGIGVPNAEEPNSE